MSDLCRNWSGGVNVQITETPGPTPLDDVHERLTRPLARAIAAAILEMLEAGEIKVVDGRIIWDIIEQEDVNVQVSRVPVTA